MAIADAELPISRVAVIDDSPRDAEELRFELTALGLEPVEIEIEDRDLEDVVAEVKANADAAICDHYLKKYKRVEFTGAEAAARLNQLQVPSCLITMYAADEDVEIRRWRGMIPAFLLRGEDGLDELADALRRSFSELHSGRPRERIPYRTTLTIERVSKEAEQVVADALVSGWREQNAVRFPLAMLPEALVPSDPRDLEGSIFFAEVNLGAERSRDLFFQNFEAAPPTDLGARLLAEAPTLDWGPTPDGDA